ncbi:glycosyltransferase [Yoonia sp. F2084L]|uniref:glycosyltransferase family 2 protein n=1 Tax=Yoonia sp. F2084L TaxID=2926419 RepID=UPI001FF6296F|nr:glycosyltransferase family 2 protein [Yoonia sp. F2084L]MCK0095589.1 glycosyltransferase [Yoonia sp. F2084L]
MKTSLIIGVCTRLRNVQLRRLLESLAIQPVPAGWAVQIIVVDNNDDPVAQEALADVTLPHPISYHHEPRVGLVHARNRALDLAQARGAGWFIGLDDDEWVSQDWLQHYLAALGDDSGLQMRMGPCQLVYAENASRFLIQKRPAQVPAGQRPKVMTTQNFAIHRSVFDTETGAGLRFHMAFNETGGEDLEFFRRGVYQHGFQAGWVPEALVFEDRKNARATLKYRLFRTMRNQISTLRINDLHQRDGIHGSRQANATRLLVIIIRHTLRLLAGLIVGGLTVLIDRDKGMQRIGKALQSGARVAAVLRFVCGMVPPAYGQSRKPT